MTSTIPAANEPPFLSLRAVEVAHTLTLAELMVWPVQTVEADATVIHARQSLERWQLSALVVMKNGQPLGIVTLRLLSALHAHGLDGLPVSSVVLPAPICAPEQTLADASALLQTSFSRLLLIVAEERLLGVITRTRLLQAIALGLPPSWSVSLETLDPSQQQLLQCAQHVAALHPVRVCMVGGIVRDLLLQRPSDDLDLMVEGTAEAVEAFVSGLQRQLGASRLDHGRFGTAVLGLPDGRHLDIALARREYYAQPAVLPSVEPGSLTLDLRRRDFTINSMAVRLEGVQAGQLLDPTGGLVDLKAGRVRVLHPLSFIDDPTRIFRALRFATRLNFELEPETHRLAKQALTLGMVERLSPERLAYEVERMLMEPTAADCLQSLSAMGGLGSLRLERLEPMSLALLRLPAHAWQALERLFQRAELPLPERLTLRLLMLGLGLEQAAQGPFLARLAIRGALAEKMRWVWQCFPVTMEVLQAARRPSERVEVLERLPVEGWALLALTLLPTDENDPLANEARPLFSSDVWPVLVHFLTHERRVKSPLNGHQLQALGVKPGPLLKRWLLALRVRVLDEGLELAEAEAWVRADPALPP
ncbi:MAG: CBS domain-containing protein [Myxococcota bacterium]